MADARAIVVAAPSSGAGKTLVTLGLIAALRARGHRIASAKVGPDYIDPRFHEAASGRVCVNLDPWAMRPKLTRALASEAAHDTDLVIVEGVMGLFDGPECGGGSTADLSALLDVPVLLVVDAASQAQSAAALVAGFAGHRSDCRIAGVILNRVSGERHERLLRVAIDAIGVPVLGAVPRSAALSVPSRHLGLVQADEHPSLGRLVDEAATLIGGSVDLDAVMSLSGPLAGDNGPPAVPPLGQRIAVAQDEAFTFAYPHLLGGWRSAGAEILPFSPLADDPPAANADAVFLPGGYPELHAGQLSAAAAFMDGLRQVAAGGALVYGECGGYMVLGECLVGADGRAHPMAGLLPVRTSFAERSLRLGYRRLAHAGALPWPRQLRGHEFHYSAECGRSAVDPLFTAANGSGMALGGLGARHGRVMGSYAHVIDAEAMS